MGKRGPSRVRAGDSLERGTAFWITDTASHFRSKSMNWGCGSVTDVCLACLELWVLSPGPHEPGVEHPVIQHRRQRQENRQGHPGYRAGLTWTSQDPVSETSKAQLRKP